MANDVHYIFLFSFFFLMLGLIAPLLNLEFGLTYDVNEFESPDEEGYSTFTISSILINLLAIPFWTFGFPWWINLWVLLPIRIPFWFVIARNIWVGGGS